MEIEEVSSVAIGHSYGYGLRSLTPQPVWNLVIWCISLCFWCLTHLAVVCFSRFMQIIAGMDKVYTEDELDASLYVLEVHD